MNKKKDMKGSASRHQSDVDWVNLQLGVNSEEKESAGKGDNGGDDSDDDCYTKTTPTPSPMATANRTTTSPPSTSHTLSQTLQEVEQLVPTFDPIDCNPETTVPHMIEQDMAVHNTNISNSSYTHTSNSTQNSENEGGIHIHSEMEEEMAATENAQQRLLNLLDSIDNRLQHIEATREKLNQDT